jgi:hypothetical protein
MQGTGREQSANETSGSRGYHLGSRDSSAANTLSYKETGAQAVTAVQDAHAHIVAHERRCGVRSATYHVLPRDISTVVCSGGDSGRVRYRAAEDAREKHRTPDRSK